MVELFDSLAYWIGAIILVVSAISVTLVAIWVLVDYIVRRAGMLWEVSYWLYFKTQRPKQYKLILDEAWKRYNGGHGE